MNKFKEGDLVEILPLTEIEKTLSSDMDAGNESIYRAHDHRRNGITAW